MLQVGPFTVNDVECLILPQDYDAPPVLAGSFLDQFTSKLDFDAAMLTIVKVDVKPVYSKTPSRTGPTTKAKETKR